MKMDGVVVAVGTGIFVIAVRQILIELAAIRAALDRITIALNDQRGDNRRS
jgi:hypothetical protein